MIPVSLRHFRTPNTNLYLNGPILSIEKQPTGITTIPGTNVTLSGVATAAFDQNPSAVVDGQIKYQWYDQGGTVLVEGSKYVGTATSQLTVNNVQTSDNLDQFFLKARYEPKDTGGNLNESIAGNAHNTVDFNSVSIGILPKITITQQPESAVVTSGNSQVFNVKALLDNKESSELSYQWYVDGVAQSNGKFGGYTYSGAKEDTMTVSVDGNLLATAAPICISVIDESTPTANTISNDWTNFRSSYPNRPFYLLSPLGTGSNRTTQTIIKVLKVPTSYIDDPLAFDPQRVNEDNGDTNLVSDWFELCNLSQAVSGTSISLFIDTSGSTSKKQVEASTNLFLEKCANANLNVYQTSNVNERWALPHNKDLPQPVVVPDKNIYCEVSNSLAYNSPLDSNTVTLSTFDPRPIVRFEAFQSLPTSTNEASIKYAFVDVNFNEVDEFVLDSTVFGDEYDTITYYTREKDLDLTMTMEAAAGGPPSPPPELLIEGLTANKHGEGGTSTVKLVHTKNVEHTVLGTTNNKAIFLYKGSNLLCVCGQGGQQGGDTAIPLAGGDGGGVNVKGQGGVGGRNTVRRERTPRPDPGSLTLNGIFGSIVGGPNTPQFADILFLQPGDSIASDINLDNGGDGGRTISCTKGRFWIDQGISPCEDNSNVPIQFYTQETQINGVNTGGWAVGDKIIRGYKPGYNIIQTEGRGWNNPPQAYVAGIGGNGGRGAIGGEGGGQQNRNRRDGAGGSGGSGYTDGTVTIIDTQLGGNPLDKAKVVFKLST